MANTTIVKEVRKKYHYSKLMVKTTQKTVHQKEMLKHEEREYQIQLILQRAISRLIEAENL
jgi:hypothetical protein